MTKTELEAELKAADQLCCKICKELGRLNIIHTWGGDERMQMATRLDAAERRRARLKSQISATKTDADRVAELRRVISRCADFGPTPAAGSRG
jgi:hypothetical protein